MTAKTKLTIKILAAIGALSIAASYLTKTSLCMFYNLVGIPCVSCGMTRAWIMALRGNFHEAFLYHPLFWCVALLPCLTLKFKAKALNAAAFTLLAVFMVVWGIRLLYMFPHTPPMTINEAAPVIKLLRRWH